MWTWKDIVIWDQASDQVGSRDVSVDPKVVAAVCGCGDSMAQIVDLAAGAELYVMRQVWNCNPRGWRPSSAEGVTWRAGCPWGALLHDVAPYRWWATVQCLVT